MRESYVDIRERIREEPQWWDEHGVPRYRAFSPRLVANIYADEACLLMIACQGCGTRFNVAMSRHGSYVATAGQGLRLDEQIQSRSIHYGDPPNIGCCAAGASMNCDDLKVVEYWRWSAHVGPVFDWKRDRALEVSLESSGGRARPGERAP